MAERNKKDTKRAAGRPRKIETSEKFNNLVDEYVKDCADKEQPITWTGMALALGFHGRGELDNYAGYDGFSHAVKRAKTIVELAYEKRLHGNSPTGAIFALKNMGWRDVRESESVTYEATPEDRQWAVHYGMSVTEYLKRKADNNLPKAPPIPDPEHIH